LGAAGAFVSMTGRKLIATLIGVASRRSDAFAPVTPGVAQGDADEVAMSFRPVIPRPTRLRAQGEHLPEDTSDVDKSLPQGASSSRCAIDPADRCPRRRHHGHLPQPPVAKGESRSRTVRATDDRVTSASTVSTREVGCLPGDRSLGDNGAGRPLRTRRFLFSSICTRSTRRIHVYPVTGRIEEAMIGMDARMIVG